MLKKGDSSEIKSPAIESHELLVKCNSLLQSEPISLYNSKNNTHTPAQWRKNTYSIGDGQLPRIESQESIDSDENYSRANSFQNL